MRFRDVSVEIQILRCLTETFFSDSRITPHLRREIEGLIHRKVFGGAFVAEASGMILRSGYISHDRGFGNMAGEKRLLMYQDTATSMTNQFNYWDSGMIEDVLNSFPAAKLIVEIDNAFDARSLPERWSVCGGPCFSGQMIALKWDKIWNKISAFDLPFPPFALGSGYGLEDVDRDEAESLGLIPRGHITRSGNFVLDESSFRYRLIKELARVSCMSGI